MLRNGEKVQVLVSVLIVYNILHTASDVLPTLQFLRSAPRKTLIVLHGIKFVKSGCPVHCICVCVCVCVYVCVCVWGGGGGWEGWGGVV